MSIAGIILRVKSKEITSDFYLKLGIKLQEHSHGGPLHYECTDFSDSPVLEIYQQSETHIKDALMLEVGSLAKALLVLSEFNMQSKGQIQEITGLKFIYCLDPDDRPVILIEKTHAIHTN
jgi:hypothetical protein